jgi:hypothetical protein
MTETQQIAQTILRQIKAADFWCLGACGARDYVALDRTDKRRGGIMFRVTIQPRKFHKIVVTYTAMDDYDVELVLIDRKTYTHKVEKSASGVYADNLAAVVYDFCNK